LLNEEGIGIDAYKIKPVQLAEVINLVDDKKISQANALQQLLPALAKQNNIGAKELALQLNLLIAEDDGEIDEFITTVLTKYSPQVQAYKTGKKGVLGLFVGEVMKMAQGKADAKKINDLIIEKLK
jgi:aspartyl-tRNA(Asn)/glutamyl-tRNA(Gln) amidotransferase subunit B